MCVLGLGWAGVCGAACGPVAGLLAPGVLVGILGWTGSACASGCGELAGSGLETVRPETVWADRGEGGLGAVARPAGRGEWRAEPTEEPMVELLVEAGADGASGPAAATAGTLVCTIRCRRRLLLERQSASKSHVLKSIEVMFLT